MARYGSSYLGVSADEDAVTVFSGVVDEGARAQKHEVPYCTAVGKVDSRQTVLARRTQVDLNMSPMCSWPRLPLVHLATVPVDG